MQNERESKVHEIIKCVRALGDLYLDKEAIKHRYTRLRTYVDLVALLLICVMGDFACRCVRECV